ncbi:MAG: DsrE family protein [Alphaproteobacteria bacterium]
MLKTLLTSVATAMLSISTAAYAADAPLAEPRPDWDNPRRVVLQLTEGDAAKANGVMHNAINLQKFYGQDNVKVALVAYAGGVKPFLREGSPVAERVASLRQYGVEFLVCGNTLDALHKTEADLLPGVAVTTSGVAELVERQLKGWTYIAP